MKGVVFTEFMEMIEDRFGEQSADRILTMTPLDSDGVYTSVGTYDHREFLQLVSNASEVTNTPPEAIVRDFGMHLFGRFSEMYPRFFEGKQDAFGFLESVDNYIHIEVKKLYPDAELPSFTCCRNSADRMTMTYESHRPFGDLAEGLIKGCMDYFGEDIEIRRTEKVEGGRQVIDFDLRSRVGCQSV